MITIERYRGRRFWAVYEDGALLCVTVYKKGALAVVGRLESETLRAATSCTSNALRIAPKSGIDFHINRGACRQRKSCMRRVLGPGLFEDN